MTSLPLGLLFLLESVPSVRGGRDGWEEAGSLGRGDCGCDLVEDDLVWTIWAEVVEKEPWVVAFLAYPSQVDPRGVRIGGSGAFS